MPDQPGSKMKQKEKVLVTGASGFIGSHLVESLLEKGYDITCLALPGEPPGYLEHLDVRFIQGDITKKNELFAAVAGVSYIYHLAALMGGGDTPASLYQVNHQGTKNLVDACLESGVKLKRFLFTSSFAAVGPTGDSQPFTEDMPANPNTNYGKSKLMAENFIKQQAGKIPFTIVRLPLVYGPRSWGGMYVYFKLITKGFQFMIGKSDTNVGFVKDVVRGMILAAESPATEGQVYFLGEDRIYNSHEIIKKIASALDKRAIKIYVPYRVVYFLAMVVEGIAKITGAEPIVRRHSLSAYLNSNWRFSMQKAREEIKFEAEYPLEKGLALTADWYRKNGYI